MVRLPHVSLHPGLAILDAVLLLLMLASSRVAAKICHGKDLAISLCISGSSVCPMMQLSFDSLLWLILQNRCALVGPTCLFVV